MSIRNAVFWLIVGLLLARTTTGCEPRASKRASVRVAAAADLSLAFTELGRRFEEQTGHVVVFSFGSSGLLAKQLQQGAPFDVFAAANMAYVDDVVGSGTCDGATKAVYARGRIALWSKRGTVPPPATSSDLAGERFRWVAMANPEHAPYGQAARQALEHAGVWSTLEPRLVLGENVRQAFQFAETGNVDAAIVALSLVVHDRDNPWVIVDEIAHRPIEQALVVCVRGENRDGGDAFTRFVNSEAGRQVMRGYGLLLPGEDLVSGP
jgi:molybdate transport system substrate-binding protein